ncbi:uncharacterized protein N0V89_003285 [Didymosphaeria variabile]|uniref:Xylanolytic transcriptional activator regulatory domain-containing protein n=1 Tax=Didymosphaeria variabile TaxID=1932322 RepID=A0A9W9CEF7_9PLEO|nr:uncharacterized protein N0V89_003285 [Didymosphaeria variabile]KAJ4358701.1 hypothetical protein N0V89_003285 [Didymosphaeria variabile]
MLNFITLLTFDTDATPVNGAKSGVMAFSHASDVLYEGFVTGAPIPRLVSTQSLPIRSLCERKVPWTATVELKTGQFPDLVAEALGPCSFVDEPLQHYIVEPTNEFADWTMLQAFPPKPDCLEASHLVSWAMRATNGALGICEEIELQQSIRDWLGCSDQDDRPLTGAFNNLIFAVGALSCPDDKDDMAAAYFGHGQYLSMIGSTGEPSILSIVCYIWTTFYLITSRQVNAGYASLSAAVRDAHGLGIHRSAVSYIFTDEQAMRERIWKALRMLDLFLSISIGRPMTTAETRDTKASCGYSCINDLAAIMETTIKTIYNSPGEISKQFVYDSMEEHRLWVDRLATELNATASGSPLDSRLADEIRLFVPLQESYHWSVMLLTWPFLFDKVSTQLEDRGDEALGRSSRTENTPSSEFSDMLVSACVNSAVRCIDVTRDSLSQAGQPKRLPYAVNSVFHSALTVGIAVFADLDQVYPLKSSLQKAQALLRTLQLNDCWARTTLRATERLQAAGESYIDRRTHRRMEFQQRMIGRMFGQLHDLQPLAHKKDLVISSDDTDTSPSNNTLLEHILTHKYAYGILAVCTLLVIKSFVQSLLSPLRNVPGPLLARFTRLWEVFAVRRYDFATYNIALHQKYGPIVRIAPNRYSINDPDEIKTILGHSPSMAKSKYYYPFGRHDQTNLFSVSDKAVHSNLKRPISQLYSNTHLLSYEAQVDKCNVVLLKSLKEFAREGQAVDFREWAQYYAFDVIGEISVGSSFGLMENNGDSSGIIKGIDDSTAYGAYCALVPDVHYPMQEIRKFLRLHNPTRAIIDFTWPHILDRAKGKTSPPKSDSEDFLTKLLRLEHEGKAKRVDTFNALGQNIAAGSDTTAISIASVIGHLAMNPDKMASLRHELESATQRGELSNPALYQEAQKLPYLQAVIQEGLRIHPAVGCPLVRVVPAGGAHIAGRYFPAGTEVGINAWVIHRNKDIFGPDADKFVPERWLTNDPGERARLERNFLAFGTGPRTCIGKNISLLELSKVIPQLVRQFDFEIVPDAENGGKMYDYKTLWFVKQKFKCFVRERTV